MKKPKMAIQLCFYESVDDELYKLRDESTKVLPELASLLNQVIVRREQAKQRYPHCVVRGK